MSVVIVINIVGMVLVSNHSATHASIFFPTLFVYSNSGHKYMTPKPSVTAKYQWFLSLTAEFLCWYRFWCEPHLVKQQIIFSWLTICIDVSCLYTEKYCNVIQKAEMPICSQQQPKKSTKKHVASKRVTFRVISVVLVFPQLENFSLIAIDVAAHNWAECVTVSLRVVERHFGNQ